jgi:hypothetical protein
MLSLMNAGSDQTVEFYAASSSNRQAIGDLTTVFTQPKERSKITYTTGKHT